MAEFWNRIPESTRGRLLVLLAGVLWSTSGAFVKTMPDLPGAAIAMYRALAAGGTLASLVVLFRIRRSWQPRMLGMAGCFTLMNYMFITSMGMTTAANTIFLQYTAPAWILLASVLWLREPASRRDVLATIGATAGIGVLIAGEWSLGANNQTGLLLGLGSGVSYAAVAVFLRSLRQHDPIWLATVNHLAAGVFLTLTILAARSFGPSDLASLSANPTPWELAKLFAFGVGQMALPYVLFARGLKSISVQEAGILTLIEPILNPFWTYLAKGELPSVWTVVGGVVLLSMLAVRYLPGTQRNTH